MKIVFFGSDEFSIKALEACIHNGCEIALVVTTPAQKKGRGLHLEPSEVCAYCRTKDIPVAEFTSLKDPTVIEILLKLCPEVFVVASYGKLIPPSLLAIPKYRLNVHPSLLPKYRGATPVNAPLLNGDTETGVTILDISEKLDAGDIYYQEKLPIGPRMTAPELSGQLAALSYGVLKKVLNSVREGRLHGTPQNEPEATFAPQLRKKDGEFSLTLSAGEIDRKVRALQPWPGCYFFLQGERIGVIETDLADTCHSEFAPESDLETSCHSQEIGNPVSGSPIKTLGDDTNNLGDDTNNNVLPGTILSIEKGGGLTVATGNGALALRVLKPEGKRSMSGSDFANGRHLQKGDILS